MNKIYVAGIGPGSPEDITPAVVAAIKDSDVVVGYKYYFQFIEQYLRTDTLCVDTGMKKERDRAQMALDYARQGKTVCVISSGDAGIYGMTPLIYELSITQKLSPSTQIIPLPGISAFQKAASLLGAPIGHDLCLISLSDLMTPWQVIEKRIKAAAMGDFVTAIYNPKSHGRYWQLYRLVELFLKERDSNTPVGYVRNAGREDEEVTVTTLGEFDPEQIDMFTVIIIGNSQSYEKDGKFITPRGYMAKNSPNLQTPSNLPQGEGKKVGQNIMMQSFRTIMESLSTSRGGSLPSMGRAGREAGCDFLWPLLHAIHTTADFEMEHLLWMDDDATARMYDKVKNGELKTIVTDVSMVASGIRKGALERLGIKVITYINDPRAVEMAKTQNITRAQAGMRIAAEEHPDALYAFGNAPTALLELCDLVRKGKCKPAGIIGAPVGFVHVEESKHAAKTLRDIPKIIIEGRKGGSNLAATLVNSVLTFDDAEQLMPGRDV